MNKINILKKILVFWNLLLFFIFIFPEYFWLFWKIWWYILFFILIIRPINDLLPNKNLNFLVNLRKELWILCWTFIIAHLLWYFLYFEINPLDILNKKILSINWYLFWWLLWFLFMLPPLLTSNNFSILYLKKLWKPIQRLTYLFFLFWAVHIAIVRPDRKIEIISFVIILCVLLLSAYIKNHVKK